MKLTEMRDWLDRRGIQLTKSLGQHFLHDGHQLDRIVAAAELTGADKVLEIGPGLGPLTERLLARAGEVLAIEKDARLVEALRERFKVGQASRLPGEHVSASMESDQSAPSEKEAFATAAPSRAGGTPALLSLLHADALELLKREPRDWSEWKLVANLPYSVASPILVELAAGRRAPRLLVVTLQLEVAQRLMAQADDDDYGVLTLLVQLDFAPRGWFKIPPGCFFPAPDVDSACVCLTRRDTPLLAEDGQRQVFRRLVKRAFSQRRKMMLKLLQQDWPKETLLAAFNELGISLQERAEKLSLQQFVALTKRLSPSQNGQGG